MFFKSLFFLQIRLGGFLIPKGTVVFPLLGMVMNSPRLAPDLLSPTHRYMGFLKFKCFRIRWFPDPSRFDPERYLSKTEDGGLRFEPSPHVMPFGYGRRRCAGETLARFVPFLGFLWECVRGELSSFFLGWSCTAT